MHFQQCRKHNKIQSIALKRRLYIAIPMCTEIMEILVVSLIYRCVVHLPLVLSVHALEACYKQQHNIVLLPVGFYVTKFFTASV